MTDHNAQRRRQVYLEWLYERSQRGVPDADGKPHPMHDKYTGLWQDRVTELGLEAIRKDAVYVTGGDV
jgi:hypothetical protein